MSVTDFKATIKSHAYKVWFDRIKDSVLKVAVKELRPSQQTAEKTNFLITDKTIREIAQLLTTKEVSDETVTEIRERMLTFTNRNKVKGSVNKDSDNTVEIQGNSIFFSEVSFPSIKSILDLGFKGVDNPNKIDISDYYQRGHVFGIATKTIEQSIDKLISTPTIDPKSKQLLLDMLESIRSKLEVEDIATSNYKDVESSLYAKYQKEKYSYLVEMQLKVANEKSGREVSPITIAIRKFFNPDKIPASMSGINFNGAQKSDQFFKELLESKGSPSLQDIIISSILDSLDGIPPKKVKYTLSETLIRSQTVKVDAKAVNKKIKDNLAKVKQLERKIKAIPLRDTKGKFYSLANLEMLIRDSLIRTVSKNMGQGNRTDILNYRSGRFANSVKLERLINSTKDGMITAFYSYMKYPYATFSEGGKQEYPKTRDPKLLIAKSIREIAETRVSNKMRSVSI